MAYQTLTEWKDFYTNKKDVKYIKEIKSLEHNESFAIRDLRQFVTKGYLVVSRFTDSDTTIELRVYSTNDGGVNDLFGNSAYNTSIIWDWWRMGNVNTGFVHTATIRNRALGSQYDANITIKTVRIIDNVETILYSSDVIVGDNSFITFSYYTTSLATMFGYEPTLDSVTMYVRGLLLTPDTSGTPNPTSIQWARIEDSIVNNNFNIFSTLESWNARNIQGDATCFGVMPSSESKQRNSYYFFNKTYDNTNILVRSIKGEYKGDGRICGYVGRGEPYNIRLVATGDLLELINDETEWHTPTLPQLTSNDSIGDYYGLLDTNIPLFNSLLDATDYLLTENTDNAINQTDLDKTSKTGMDGTEARFERANTYDIRAVASRILDVSEVHSDIIRWMESLNDPSVSDTIDMFWWTNNPIECLTAYYWSPLDMSEIGRTLPHSANLVKFGGVYAKNVDTGEEISATPLNAQGAEILLGQYQFNRKYNDWRDYTVFNYKLYLPFYGLVDLEPYYITGKRLEVKYVYYPTNHTIRYMIFVKQNLYKAIDCSVGIDLPMTSSDAVGKAQKNFSDALSIPSDVKSITDGNVIGGITSIIGKGLEMSKKPSLLNWGSINPTTNIGDPLQAMLYIEEQQTIIPNKLYETYGHANYYIGSIGALSGYCEFSDVRLVGCGTLSDNEKEELKGLLMKGVIL